MATVDRMFLLTYIVTTLATCVWMKAHQEFGPEDSEELARINRRVDSIYARDLQYDGLPIDAGSERNSGRKQESARRQSKSKSKSNKKHVKPKPSRSTTDISQKVSSKIPLINPPNNRQYRRIYNADETVDVEKFPFMAALLVNDALWCGAALIANDRIVTAAHCLQLQYNNRFFREYVKMLSVRIGSSNATAGGEVYPVTDIYFHPNYKPETLEFNFAVVKINTNITFVKDNKAAVHVSPIEVARGIVPNDRNISFLGWGSVYGEGGVGGQVLLQRVDLPVYDLADCQEVYGRELVTRTNFCAGYITRRSNVCNHDAGGPAIMTGELVGILSFSSKRCDEFDKPAVFSSVASVSEWIQSLDQDPTLKFGIANPHAP